MPGRHFPSSKPSLRIAYAKESKHAAARLHALSESGVLHLSQNRYGPRPALGESVETPQLYSPCLGGQPAGRQAILAACPFLEGLPSTRAATFRYPPQSRPRRLRREPVRIVSLLRWKRSGGRCTLGHDTVIEGGGRKVSTEVRWLPLGPAGRCGSTPRREEWTTVKS